MPFYKFRLVQLTVLLFIILSTMLISETQVFAGDGFKQINVPDGYYFWSELTSFEQETLRQIKQGSDADTLFNLSLILSGKIRTRRHALPYIQKRDAFIQKMRPVLDKQTDPTQKALTLYHNFQTHFLGNSGSSSQTNYSLRQKDVHVLFASKKYNCYSSAVAFGLIAMKFGYKVQGVGLKDHAFIRISGNGLPKIVEIETTNYHGFDSPQDKTRYRNHPRLSYRDYAAKVLYPFPMFIWDVIYQRNQWVSISSDSEKIRIAEITGHLDNTLIAQSYRMAGWFTVFKNLINSDRQAELITFYNKISHVLWAVSGKKTSLRSLNINASLVFSFAGFSMIRYGKPEQGMKLLEHSKKLFETGSMKKEDFDRNITITTSYYIARAIRKGENENALKMLQWTKKMLWNKANCNEVEQKYYLNLAYRYSPARLYQKDAQALTKCVALPKSETYDKCKSRLERAYMNWSVAHMNSGNYAQVEIIMKKCITLDSNHKECQKRLRSIKGK